MDERVTNTEKRKLFRERRVERDASCLLFVHSDCVSFPLSVVFYSSLRGLSSFPTSLRPFLLWTRVRFYHIGTQMYTINILIPRTAACLDDLLLNFQPGFFWKTHLLLSAELLYHLKNWYYHVHVLKGIIRFLHLWRSKHTFWLSVAFKRTIDTTITTRLSFEHHPQKSFPLTLCLGRHSVSCLSRKIRHMPRVTSTPKWSANRLI